MTGIWDPDAGGRIVDGQIQNTPDEQALIDAHRARTAAAEANQAALHDRLDQAVANLETAWDNWDTLTPAQKDQALRLNIRVTAGLARLQLRKLDTAG